MKNVYLLLGFGLAVIIIALMPSCRGRSNSNTENSATASQLSIPKNSQIANYVVHIFEDSNQNIWFGTLTKGVGKFDGKTFRYLTTKDGLPGNTVVSITEDKDGYLWFGTRSGLSRYDGKTFMNFNLENGICNNTISNLLIDSRGDFWVGTWAGVCRFNGKGFTKFDLPIPTIDTLLNKDTINWITKIMEDSKGNIWFGRDGYGACKYDGKKFVHFLKKDGIYSNNVQEITEDSDGNIWFASRVAEKDLPDASLRFGSGGVTKYDGSNFSHFPEIEGIHENDVYEIYRDKTGNLWISTISNGAYKYDGKDFTNYSVVDPVDKTPKAIMSFLEDSNGAMWIGCAGGLFRLDANGTVNITTDGPWN
ncbi:MAG: two-component regulator propeller domain-containing protein [Bacteroidota bacterium]